jgi:hypothetical protein
MTIRGMIQMNCIPDSKDSLINLIPVDTTSQLIVSLSLRKESTLVPLFHLINIRSTTSLSIMMKAMCNFHPNLTILPYNDWKQKVHQIKSAAENVLYPFVDLFMGTSFPSHLAPECGFLRKALQDLDSLISIPDIDHDYFIRSLEYLKRYQLI